MRKPVLLALVACSMLLQLPAMASPLGAAKRAAPTVELTPLNHIVEVSSDGRWIAADLGSQDTTPPRGSYDSVILDRLTGTQVKADVIDTGFVRDNPNLWLSGNEDGQVGIRLIDRTTGSDRRVDTDSAGQPITPSWSPELVICGYDDCGFAQGAGHIAVVPESVSRDGSLVAYCANYLDAEHADLYLKNMVTGDLRDTGANCGFDDSPLTWAYAPEIDADGSVVHVRGNSDVAIVGGAAVSSGQLTSDTLYFTSGAGEIRTLSGRGSMTGDGSTVFMRLRSLRQGYLDLSGAKSGAYSVASQRVTKLPGKAESTAPKLSTSRRSSTRVWMAGTSSQPPETA